MVQGRDGPSSLAYFEGARDALRALLRRSLGLGTASASIAQGRSLVASRFLRAREEAFDKRHEGEAVCANFPHAA